MAFRLKLVPDETKIDFFRWQVLTFGISSALALLSVVALLIFGLNFGIDFKGGTTIRTESTQPIDVGVYRQALQPLNLGDVSITQVYDPGFRADQYVAQVRIGAQSGAEAVTPQTIEAVQGALKQVDPPITFPSVESVGPKVSAELIRTAVYSVLTALVAISVYIWLRFEWQFALGAIVSLVHDVLITMGVFAVFQIKFDLTTIAALLTIVGYSINDTVVVFDKVRENTEAMRESRKSYRQAANLAVNQTLVRSVNTSRVALLPVGAILYVGAVQLGGSSLQDLALALFVGMAAGTYSSVCIATPLLVDLKNTEDEVKLAEKRAKARQRAAADPYAQAGVFSEVLVQPFVKVFPR